MNYDINQYANKFSRELIKKMGLFVLLVFILSGCNGLDETIEYRVDPRLKHHVDKFFEEAAKRGISLDTTNIIASVVPEKQIHAAGIANNPGRQCIIRISDDVLNYFQTQGKDTAYYATENLIFHELGHTILHRKHNDPKFSIMAAGLSFYTYVSDNDVRKYLVDELFNPNL